MNTKKNNAGILALLAVIVLAAIFGGLTISRNVGKSSKTISRESSLKKLESMVRKIEPVNGTPTKGTVEYTGEDTTFQELPELKQDSIAVFPSTDFYAEIFSSSEKTGQGRDSFLREMAEDYNKAGMEVNGKKASIQLRTVSSGQQVDYVASGKYVPDGISPSNDLFVKMLEARGADVSTISDSLVDNYAGIVMPKKVYNNIKEQYGSVDVKTIAQATSDSFITMGYTNPFTSAAGMNFLVTLLDSYDSGSILSEKAQEGFRSFQSNIPFVSMTTGQMRTAAERGTFDAFVSEYQTYLSDRSLSTNNMFVPYGYRHANPLVSVSADEERQAILGSFAEYCKANGAKLAKEDGFNQTPDNYQPMATEYSGDDLIEAQKLYKENKDQAPIVCVFVADVSGSMDGEPLNNLKESLSNAIQYINPDNYIGLVSYSEDVTIELPIAKFDMKQQSLFQGTVDRLVAAGNTATFDAVCVASDMIEKQLENVPDAKPMLFVLSDGETNTGYSIGDIKDVVSGLKIPVYTICYNGNFDAMEELSNINEGVNINADTDDVTYQLKQLFNASM